MYLCQKCQQQLKVCPACKHNLRDPKASLFNQLSGLLVFLTLIFVSLEIKVTEETEIAMKPFRAAQEELENRRKVKEAEAFRSSSDSSSTEPRQRKSAKVASAYGREGDFRAGVWGMLKSEIVENETAQHLEFRDDPYDLDYKTRIGNFDVVARYMFAQGRLSAGCYILLGPPIEGLDKIKKDMALKVGEPTPSWIKLDFNYYSDEACPILNSLPAVDQFFYEMYISLASQMGPPEETVLNELEHSLTRNEKIESVLVHERMLTYRWQTIRSKVNFYFASLNGRPYFRLEFLSNKKEGGAEK